MKRSKNFLPGALLLAVGMLGSVANRAFVYDTPRELFGTGDFDGDGQVDVVIVDKTSGKYRLGYQFSGGSFNWVEYRLSGMKDVTGLAIGRLFDPGRDALAFTSADRNLIAVSDVSSPTRMIDPQPIDFASLGPHAILALDVGGAGNTPLDDLVVGSVYNFPDPGRVTVLRDSGGQFETVSETDSATVLARANRLSFQTGGPVYGTALLRGDEGDTFRIEDWSGGTAARVAEVGGLPKNSDYLVAKFGDGTRTRLLVYQPGGTNVQVWALGRNADGQFNVTPGQGFALSQPIRLLTPAPTDQGAGLLAIFGQGESAEVYAFDGVNAPARIHTITPAVGELLFGAVDLEKRFLLFSGPDFSKFSTQAEPYRVTGTTCATGTLDMLAPMADRDDFTAPDIHRRVLEVLQSESINSEADMRAYTNTIPGSAVTYAMAPIPGGEFLMGSPASEKDRKADEGPQHKVMISPFWMGQDEVTWDAYELFMYPMDEKRLRENFQTDAAVNEVADAVTRPSKPYVEMSFGMGKDGYPAICMTQHGANKFCHWLSAKTGHFYRLPTEAEWEYACRAGTTTAYSFGNDPRQLGDYAWFEDNSDFKYGKVGKKKPNPWGLYDMHGNVWEWCLDQYEPNYDNLLQMTADPWNKATKPYPHAVRGGSYDDMASDLRSAARLASGPDWKMRDPQLPKSIWWHSDAQFVGIRIVRPLKVPPPGDMVKYWTSGVEKE